MSAGRAARLVLILVLVLAASQALTGCGSGVSSSAAAGTSTSGPAVPALLNGNWNLAGNRALAQYPLLSMALIVDGNQITANGDDLVHCSNINGTEGGAFSLTGQIASDGTFALTESPVDARNSIQVAVTGTAPAVGSNTWTGTYSFTDLAGYTNCIVNQTGALTATAFAPFNGTYTGSLVEGSTASPTGSVTVSFNVSQGAATGASSAYPGYPYLPLTATVTVSGSPCFNSGATNTTSFSDVEGDHVNLSFTMSDGSQAFIEAVFASPDESSLSMVTFPVFGGLCKGTGYYGTLAKQ